MSQEDYKQTYEEFWKKLVETDGKLDPDKVMRELHDYKTVLDEVPKVYDHVTGGQIGKPNTRAEHVMAAHDERRERQIQEALEDERESQDMVGEDA